MRGVQKPQQADIYNQIKQAALSMLDLLPKDNQPTAGLAIIIMEHTQQQWTNQQGQTVTDTYHQLIRQQHSVKHAILIAIKSATDTTKH